MTPLTLPLPLLVLSILLLTIPLTIADSSGDTTVYLIRHGEKPASGDGLSAAGLQRAQCLRTVFGGSSKYDIRYIMAETPKSSGARVRPYDTVLPLSQDLGLTIDTSCDRDDSQCVKTAVEAFQGPGNVLICWEHSALTGIVEKLGVSTMDAPNYPDASFNLIWTDPSPYDTITDTDSECCPGLDS